MSKSLWIARDRDGGLYLYSGCPSRGKGIDTGRFYANIGSEEIFDDVYAGYQRYFAIERNAFPEVTWENSPKELIIKEE